MKEETKECFMNIYTYFIIPLLKPPQYSTQKDGLRQYSRIEMNKYSVSSEKPSLLENICTRHFPKTERRTVKIKTVELHQTMETVMQYDMNYK